MVLKGRVGEIDFLVHPLPLFPAPTAFIVCLPFWNLVWKKKRTTTTKGSFQSYTRLFQEFQIGRVSKWNGKLMKEEKQGILQQVK